MNVHGDAVDDAQLLLRVDDRVAMHTSTPLGEVDPAVLGGVVGGDGDVLDALGHQHLGHLGHRAQTGGVLAAGHRDGCVVEDLERHRRARGDGCLDRELAAVEVGAIAHVLEEVGVFDERRRADPLGAFATHLGDTHDVTGLFARDDADHAVTTNPGTDERAFWHQQAGVVRAAGTEERRAHRLGAEGDPHRFGFAHGGELVGRNSQCQHTSQRIDEVVDGQRAVVGDQWLAIVIDLADDRRRIRGAVQDRRAHATPGSRSCLRRP